MINMFNEEFITTEGIFRVSGSVQRITSYKVLKYNNNNNNNNSNNNNNNNNHNHNHNIHHHKLQLAVTVRCDIQRQCHSRA